MHRTPHLVFARSLTTHKNSAELKELGFVIHPTQIYMLLHKHVFILFGISKDRLVLRV